MANKTRIPTLELAGRLDSIARLAKVELVSMYVVEAAERLRELHEPTTPRPIESAPKEWVVQSGGAFHCQQIETWKSDSGEWGFAYGITVGACLIPETLVTGFATEEDAFQAANKHCYELACEKHGKSDIKLLTIAGALIAAEIDRLLRLKEAEL